MVEKRICSFCGVEIEPGTGKLYVKRDGTVLAFDSNKCYINMVQLGRVPRRTTWTRAYAQLKAAKVKAAAPVEAAPVEEAVEEPVEAKPAPKPKKAKKAKTEKAE